jgi:hypothetical protein
MSFPSVARNSWIEGKSSKDFMVKRDSFGQ